MSTKVASLQAAVAAAQDPDEVVKLLTDPARRGAVSAIRRLDLSGKLVRSETFAEFLAGEERLFKIFAKIDVSGLQTLDVSRNYAACFQPIVDTVAMDSLVTLNLSGTVVGPGGARSLASLSHLNSLQSLDLTACGLDDEAAQELARGRGLRCLRYLCLRENKIGDSGKKVLLQSEKCKRVNLRF